MLKNLFQRSLETQFLAANHELQQRGKKIVCKEHQSSWSPKGIYSMQIIEEKI
jgi:hypothetical protein